MARARGPTQTNARRKPWSKPTCGYFSRLLPTFGVRGSSPTVQKQLFGQCQAAVGLQQAEEQRRVHCAPEPRALGVGVRAPRGCEGAGATRSHQRVQRPGASPPTPASPAGSFGVPLSIRSLPGPWPREASGLAEMRGGLLDHDQ